MRSQEGLSKQSQCLVREEQLITHSTGVTARHHDCPAEISLSNQLRASFRGGGGGRGTGKGTWRGAPSDQAGWGKESFPGWRPVPASRGLSAPELEQGQRRDHFGYLVL